MKSIVCILYVWMIPISVHAQTIIETKTPVATSLRGLSVVNDNIIWTSGSNGMVGKSTDGGVTWHWTQVKGFEKSEFRDIEAFDAHTAIIMSIASPAYILRTINGGKDWQVVFVDSTKEMFLDALFFWNEKSGMVIGDPINNRFYIARTFNGGKTWQKIPKENLPIASEGEALFAASGTNIGRFSKSEAVFVTGGSKKRFYKQNDVFDLPIKDTSSTAGPNSIAVKNKRMIIAAGDFMKKDETEDNCLVSKDGGITWFAPTTPPSGYRSCVIFYRKQTWITCGMNGVDISDDDGMNWKPISKTGFHVVQKSKKDKAVFFAGNNKVGKLSF